MGILGSVVKNAVALNQKLKIQLRSPEEEQERQLVKLLEKAKNTAFGKYYGFKTILKSDDVIAAYRNQVPLHDYNKMKRWWSQQQQYPDITWPGKPDFFALSSGTTGKSSKRIPITKDFLQSIRDVGTSFVGTLPNFSFDESIYENEILMLSSSSDLNKSKKGHLEGEISGINVSNFPGWYDLFYRPGKDIAAINDWDERIDRIASEAPNWNIGAVAGIPSWVLLMLKNIIAKNGLANIHEIWPDFQVYVSGGVAFETYRKDFEALCQKPITILDTYLASEGFFAYTARPKTMAMQMALSHGYYFEFIPFNEKGVDERGELLENPEIYAINEVNKEEEYVLVVSTCGGAWRYIIGDTIKFVGLDPYEIKITGRTKFFLNVVGAQLSEEKMDRSIIETSENLEVNVNEYMVAVLKTADNNYFHQWVIVTDQSVNENTFAEYLDNSLKDLNKNYQVARDKALDHITVKQIKKADYYQYLESKKKKGGQVKTPKVMKEEEMTQLLRYFN
ncbi:MAG: GH3 auxin-responsive promoter family protein [Fulvivirga sp.]|nr:GH3 auxin-responsive promoter family protein [Fulvivirga sp.]